MISAFGKTCTSSSAEADWPHSYVPFKFLRLQQRSRDNIPDWERKERERAHSHAHQLDRSLTISILSVSHQNPPGSSDPALTIQSQMAEQSQHAPLPRRMLPHQCIQQKKNDDNKSGGEKETERSVLYQTPTGVTAGVRGAVGGAKLEHGAGPDQSGGVADRGGDDSLSFCSSFSIFNLTRWLRFRISEAGQTWRRRQHLAIKLLIDKHHVVNKRQPQSQTFTHKRQTAAD